MNNRHIRTSKLAGTLSAFFIEGDRFYQAIHRLPQSELSRRLGLYLLYFDYVFITSAYYWQSEQTRELVNFYEPFVRDGSLLFVIRSPNSTRDCIDYFDARLEEHSSWYRFRGPLTFLDFQRPEMRENAIILNGMAYFLSRDEYNLEEVYINLFEKTILNHESGIILGSFAISGAFKYNTIVSVHLPLPVTSDFSPRGEYGTL